MYVSQTGYKKVVNFLKPDEVAKLTDLFVPNKKVTQFDKSSAHRNLSDVFGKVEALIEDQADYSVRFSKLWLVHSVLNNVDTTKLPYLPHFDRLRFLKVMIYLTDTDEASGAFYASKANVHDTELVRRTLPENHKEQYLNDATNLGEFEPVLGKAGDAIIFDTNCPHFAGAVAEGHERKVARFDYTNSHWNSYWGQSMWQKLIAKR